MSCNAENFFGGRSSGAGTCGLFPFRAGPSFVAGRAGSGILPAVLSAGKGFPGEKTKDQERPGALLHPSPSADTGNAPAPGRLWALRPSPPFMRSDSLSDLAAYFSGGAEGALRGNGRDPVLSLSAGPCQRPDLSGMERISGFFLLLLQHC